MPSSLVSATNFSKFLLYNSLSNSWASSGSNQKTWFVPEDAQELLNELYNKNFEKFVADTKLDGMILKLR